MNNTALRAGAQSADNTHMVFANGEHEKLEQARYQDCYHKSLIYILDISEVGLVFNLYTDGTSNVGDYKRRDEQIYECCSVSEIFCCGYALYFWQGMKLRYPKCCKKQKLMKEILAEMEKEHVENSTDGNKE